MCLSDRVRDLHTRSSLRVHSQVASLRSAISLLDAGGAAMGDRAGGDAAQRAEENRSAEAQQEVRMCVCVN